MSKALCSLLNRQCALNHISLQDQARPDLGEPVEPKGFSLEGEIAGLKADLHDLKEKYLALEAKVQTVSGNITIISFITLIS